jgi:hypothetical protein
MNHFAKSVTSDSRELCSALPLFCLRVYDECFIVLLHCFCRFYRYLDIWSSKTPLIGAYKKCYIIDHELRIWGHGVEVAKYWALPVNSSEELYRF